jgi:two-component system CheB/CheR fusion protein
MARDKHQRPNNRPRKKNSSLSATIKSGATHMPLSGKANKPTVLSGVGLFPIVGIGASAGGLEAFTDLLQRVPPDTGMGFVLVQHLDPDHESAN